MPVNASFGLVLYELARCWLVDNWLMSNTFSDQVVVVTGAASGIGKSLAKAFLADGARVVLTDIDKAALDVCVEELGSSGDVLGVAADVSREDDVWSLSEAVEREFGVADVLCNNAGIGVAGLSWEMPANVWDWTLGVNVGGVMNCVRAFVPAMVERNSGHVLNVASVAGLLAPIGMSAYTASKHAVVGLSEVMFHEFAAKGAAVGVSVLCPGMVDTNISDSHLNWPAHLGDPPESFNDRTSQVVRKKHKRALSRSMPPEEAARIALDGISEGRFWIFTDDVYMADIRERFAGAVAGQMPVASQYV